LVSNTRGIVLHQLKYAETSVVAKVYTELYGLQSYLINNVYSKKAKIKPNILQPLTLLDMEVYHKEKGGLQRLKYATAINPASKLQTDINKMSLSIFLAEVLYRSIQEEERNPKLFEFLLAVIELLDKTEDKISNFHLVFMVQLSGHLGFIPSMQPSAKHCFFNKRDGIFETIKPNHRDWMDQKSTTIFNELLSRSFSDNMELKITSDQRFNMIEHLIAYYKLHLDKMPEIKSHKVLQAVMN